jgi:hypothetical protein
MWTGREEKLESFRQRSIDQKAARLNTSVEDEIRNRIN